MLECFFSVVVFDVSLDDLLGLLFLRVESLVDVEEDLDADEETQDAETFFGRG